MKIKSSKSGVALLTVIIFLLIIASLASTGLFLMTGTSRISSGLSDKAKAQYVAEAAIVQNLDRLAQNPANPPQNVTIALDGKNYTAVVNFTPNVAVGSGGQYIVTQVDATVNY